jgi:NAD(P)-dependent dehydrogenase (short-subunit alcohol dehydrogenase family)/acyl dehydratase
VADPVSPIERELRFTPADLELFAAASGDRNPLHIDPNFARKSAFGRCVVHGALVSLGLLGLLPADELAQIRWIRAWFSGAVLLDTTLSAAVIAHGERRGAWEIRLTGRGKALTRLLVRSDGDAAVIVDDATLASRAPGSDGGRAMRTAPVDDDVVELSVGHAIAGEYRTAPELRAVARRFGVEALRPALLEGLAWASYVVGMEMPGRHGLFAGVTLRAAGGDPLTDGPAERQSIRLRDHDERTGRLLIEGALFDRSGTAQSSALIECFALAPTTAPDASALGIAASEEPVRGAVVVIGGSRGFGAALALSLLANGYAVHVVYSSSSDSAAELAKAARPLERRLFLHHVDARDPKPLADAIGRPDSPLAGLVLNAAPPPLSMGVTGESGAELAEYVAESLRLTAVPLGALLPLVDADAGWVLFCSSPAVMAPPRDWPHYAAAKGALEGLARWLAATAPKMRTVVVRPPKMRTDLTNTPSGRIAAAPTEAVATWIVKRISNGDLGPGLSVFEPDAAEFQPGEVAPE